MIAIVAGAVSCGVAAGLWAARRAVVGAGIEAALGWRGLTPVALQVEAVSLEGLVLRAVRIGDPAQLELRRVDVGWSWKGLRARRVDRIDVAGLRARASLDEPGVFEAVLEGGAGSPGDPSLVPFPLGALTLEDVTLELATSSGAFELTIAGSFVADPVGVLAGGMDWRLAHPWLAVSGEAELSGTLEEATLRIRGQPEFLAPPVPIHLSEPGRGARSAALIRATFVAGSKTPLRGEFALDGVDLAVREPPIALHGLALEAQLEAGAIHGTIEVARLEDSAETPTFPTLNASARFDGTTGQIGFAGFVRSGEDAIRVDLSGQAEPLVPSANVRFRLAPTQLGRAGTRVRALLPGLAESVQSWSGSVNAEGTALFEAGALALDGEVGFTGLGLVSPELGRLAALTGRLTFEGAASGVPGESRGPLPGIGRGELVISGARLEPQMGNLSIDGVVARARLDGDALTGSLGSARIADGSDPPLFAPLHATGSFTGTTRRLTFEAELADADRLLHFEIEGSAEPPQREASADFRLRPVQLDLVGTRLGRLLPLLAGRVESASGEIEVIGEAKLAEAATFSAAVALRDIDAHGPFGAVTALNGAIAVSGPDPLESPPSQLISMALVDLGLPLADGLVEFQLQPEFAVEVADAAWHWAGGRIRTAGRFDLAAESHEAVLQLEELDLAALTDELQLPGLTGTGMLRGQLPLVLSGESVIIREGMIESVGPGTLRYPREPGSEVGQPEGLALLRAALEDFRFDRLALRINGDARGEVNVGISLSGNNPNLQQGRTVQLEVTVDARLGDLLRSAQESYRIPELIEERLRRFGAEERP